MIAMELKQDYYQGQEILEEELIGQGQSHKTEMLTVDASVNNLVNMEKKVKRKKIS